MNVLACHECARHEPALALRLHACLTRMRSRDYALETAFAVALHECARPPLPDWPPQMRSPSTDTTALAPTRPLLCLHTFACIRSTNTIALLAIALGVHCTRLTNNKCASPFALFLHYMLCSLPFLCSQKASLVITT